MTSGSQEIIGGGLQKVQTIHVEDFRKFVGHRCRTFVIKESAVGKVWEVSRIKVEDFRKSEAYR